ncbi:TlpA family protein disulfide reductase [Corynebacterium argentoratense]|uniref:TlpA family protein disulfide reductase n=1 Tax=Corynebacterium argentoratense TaxID=42817 RepID=UPI001F26FBE8|nr:TlpA disulfide reductase family protein [Corynebacterium argentoratense]MCF1712086.1 TlpA family protein disulfide reductase [Corynebacterium argentoratense]
MPARTQPRRTARLVLAATTMIATTLSLTACSNDDTTNKQNTTFSFYAPGGQTLIQYPQDERKPLNNFSGESLMHPGETISLDDYDGKVLVLNAWGQWCGPCRTEVDDLETIQENIANKGGAVLGINVRDYSPEVARDFLKDAGVTYDSIYDPPFKTAAALGGVPASVIPTTIILDKQHRPAAVFLREINADEVLNIVEPLLEEQQ